MSSRNPFGDTSDDFDDDRNETTSSGARDSTSPSGGGDRTDTSSSRDRDDDDRSRNPLGDTSRGRSDDRNATAPGGDTAADQTRLERAETQLDELGERFTETVAEPVGDITAATNPAARAEERLIGTDRLSRLSEGAGEGVAELANAPAIAGGAIDVTQGLDRATTRANDPVTIGGVPTGLTVPDPEGQDANRDAAAGAAAGAAAAAAREPFSTTGRLVGSAAGGAAASRGIARVAGRTTGSGSSSGVDADPVPSGRSNVGTSGRGSILDPDDVGNTDLRGDAVEVVDDVADPVETGGRTGGGSDALPLADDITDAGGVRRLLDEQRAGVRDFLDDDRAQLGAGRQRSPDTDTRRPSDGADRVSDNLVQQSLNRQQRAGRGALEEGDFDGAGSPFGPGSRAGDFDEPRFDPPTGGGGAAGGSAGGGGGGLGDAFGAAVGAGASPLGEIDPVNDPTGIAPGVSAPAGAAQPGVIADAEAGTGSLGDVDPVTDPTGIAPDQEPDTGTLLGGASATDTRQDVEALTELREELDLRADTTIRPQTRSDTAQRTGSRSGTDSVSRTSTVRTPTRGGGGGLDPIRPGRVTGGSGRISTRPPTRLDTEFDEDFGGDDERDGVGFQAVSEDFENPAVGIDVADDELTDDLADIDDPFEFSS